MGSDPPLSSLSRMENERESEPGRACPRGDRDELESARGVVVAVVCGGLLWLSFGLALAWWLLDS